VSSVETKPPSSADASDPPVIRFGEFELDIQAADLRKRGKRIRLQEQPFRILVELLERPGQLISREEIRRRLWPDDTSVEFDHSINAAVKRLRDSLGDSAESPRFIETIPKRGYRFIGSVSRDLDQAPQPESMPGSRSGANVVDGTNWSSPHQSSSTVNASTVVPSFPKTRTRQRIAVLAVCGACLLLAEAGWFVHKKWHADPPLPVQRALTRLTFEEGLQIGATWSPDGRYIAYSSDRGGKSDIWLQQISGGDPIQVTHGPGQNWQPDWSPDGRYIAYRSEEGDGGINITRPLGGIGQQRKVAPFGYYPLWSPDSSKILLQTHFDAFNSNRFYIAQLDGSPAHEVLGEFLTQKRLSAMSAAWHPDGKRITVWVQDSSPSPSFWIVPLAGGPGVKLEITPVVQKELAEFSAEGESGDQQGDASFSWSALGDAIYFERGFRGATNIFKLTVDPETLQATRIERLTTGPGSEAGVAISRDGKRLAFTANAQQIRTWLFPFEATTGQIKVGGNAISPPGRTSVDPNLSPDGTKVAYDTPRGESDNHLNVRNELWLKLLRDGRETPVIADDYSRWYPHWSPDSTQLVYERRNPRTNEHQIMVWSSHSHEEQPLTELDDGLGAVSDWCPDGKSLLTAARDGIWLVPVTSASRAEPMAKKIASNPAYHLHQAHMSPDGRWIVFNAQTYSANTESSLFVIPTTGGPWTRITDGKHWDDKPRWSPDGKTIYFISRPGGYFNVWGIHFDPAAGKPVGQPFQVSKFDSPRLMIPRWIAPVGLSLTQDKLVLTVAQASGNIWVLDDVDR
jgi:Tol biopolymer transport system component/DNA-binding winged helix-turn-helix (wHTH) protein